MKPFLKVVFQPVANRHYTSRKISALNYAFGYIPALLICLYGAIFVDRFFAIAFVAICIWGLVDYLLFDALLDKITWKLFWSRFYSPADSSKPQGYDAMGRYEKNPNQENYEAVEAELNRKQS